MGTGIVANAAATLPVHVHGLRTFAEAVWAFAAISIPYLMFIQHDIEPDAAFGGWLMPVVPPMVSAAAGALLIGDIAPGSGRQTLLYGCYAMS
jgi:tellurite resistance protein TehA-like permease